MWQTAIPTNQLPDLRSLSPAAQAGIATALLRAAIRRLAAEGTLAPLRASDFRIEARPVADPSRRPGNRQGPVTPASAVHSHHHRRSRHPPQRPE